MISLAPLGWGDEPQTPPDSRRTRALIGSRESKHRGAEQIASASAAPSAFRLPTSQRSTSPITGSREAIEATVSATSESAIMMGRPWML